MLPNPKMTNNQMGQGSEREMKGECERKRKREPDLTQAKVETGRREWKKVGTKNKSGRSEQK